MNRRNTRRLAMALGVVAIAVVGALAVRPEWFLIKVYFHRSEDRVPLPSRPSPRDQADANLQDLNDLAYLLRLDRSFSDRTRAAFTQGLADMRKEAGGLSPAAFAMGVSRLVALADNGHTTVDTSDRADRFGQAPLRLDWFADGLYVVNAGAPQSDLLGDRILSIDGRPVETAMAAVRPYLSGTDERARIFATPIFVSPPLLQAIWPDTDGDHLTLDVVTPAGEKLERVVEALPPALGRDPAGWVSVTPAGDSAPLSLRDPDRVAYSQDLEKGGVYVRINANGDDDKGRLENQLAAVLKRAPPGGWRWMALDLRFNDGGDVRKTYAFARALPKVLQNDGSVWILTGNATFSAAIVAAAQVKHFLGDRAHIVGEPVGDRGQFWAEGGPSLVLRNSGIEIHYADFMYDWAEGCHSIRRCFPIEFLYGVAVGDLHPEIAVGWEFSDYAAGRDTVLDRVKELVGVGSDK